MNRTEIEEFATMKADVKYIKESLDENKIQHAELKCMITDFINSADNKYASKRIEVAVYWTVGIVIMAVLTAGLRLILV